MSYAVPPTTTDDDAYRTPPRPQSFEGALWWFDAMRIGKAHRQTTGEGVTVALVESPLDPSVPELRGQDVRHMTDCRGNRITSAQPGDYHEHATGMASLIVGSGQGDAPGGRGVPGVAPGARLLVYSADVRPQTKRLDCLEGEIATLFDAAVRDGADIISVSLGLNHHPWLLRAVRRAVDAGVVVVAAAGDTSSYRPFEYPAWSPGVVGVGAIDEYAQLWKHTPTNEHAAIAAPGVWVSTGTVLPGGAWTSEWATNGTSPATAITAGALALVKSKYPEATGNQLVQHLIHTPRGDGYDWDPGHGFGIVNVTDMLRSSPTQWPDENPLLTGPRKTLKSYPMWVSSRVEDPPGEGENAPVAPSTQQSAQSSQSAQQTPQQETTGAAAPQQAGSGAGLPAWGWVLVAAGLLVAAAGAATMNRRGRRPVDVVRQGSRGA